jgi:MFS family permease
MREGPMQERSSIAASMGRRGAGFTALLLVWFVNGALSGPLTTQLPVYIDTLHRPVILTSSLQAVQMGFGGVFSLLGGILADRIGIKRALLIGMAGSLFACLEFYRSDVLGLVVLAALAGAAIGCQSVASQAYLLSVLRGLGLGLGAAAFFLGNTLGSSLGNAIAGIGLNRYGFAPTMAVDLVGSGLLVGVAALCLPAIRRVGHAESLGTTLVGFGHLLRREGVWLLCSVRYLTTCYWGAVTLLLPLLIYEHTGSKAAAGIYAAVSLASAACCSLAVGRISDHVGRTRPAIVLVCIIIVDAFLLARVSGSYPGLFAAGVLGASTAWSLSAVMPGLIDGVSREGEKGRAVGLLQGVWSAAMLSGALIGGVLIAHGTAVPFLVVGCANLLSLVAVIALARRIGTGVPKRLEEEKAS